MRREGWFYELCGVLARWMDAPFSYGRHDCCTFAAACIDAMTGTWHRAMLTASYHDETGARAFIQRCGGLSQAIETILGAPSRGRRRTGDCVVFRARDGQPTCGIIFGPIIVSASRTGLAAEWRRGILAHWSI